MSDRNDAPDPDDIDARIQAAGLIPIADHLAGRTPMAPWVVDARVTDLDAYEHWLERKAAAYLRMQARYDLGDKDKNDEMYDWTVSKAGTFLAALLTFRAARAGKPSGA